MTGSSAEARRNRIAAQQAANASQPGLMSQIGSMGQSISSSLTGAIGGAFEAVGQFGEYLSQLTDPIQKIDAEIASIKAQVGGIAINAGKGGVQEAIDSLNKTIADLEKKKKKIQAQQKKARDEEFARSRADAQQAAQDAGSGALFFARDPAAMARQLATSRLRTRASSGSFAGSGIVDPGLRSQGLGANVTGGVTNLNNGPFSLNLTVQGAFNPGQIFNMVDEEARRRGYDRTGRSFLRSK
jgi:hypothetical protein